MLRDNYGNQLHQGLYYSTNWTDVNDHHLNNECVNVFRDTVLPVSSVPAVLYFDGSKFHFEHLSRKNWAFNN